MVLSKENVLIKSTVSKSFVKKDIRCYNCYTLVMYVQIQYAGYCSFYHFLMDASVQLCHVQSEGVKNESKGLQETGLPARYCMYLG